MENVRAIAFTEQDIDIFLNEFEIKFPGLYCIMQYRNIPMVDVYDIEECDDKNHIIEQLNIIELIELIHPFFNINLDNSIVFYDNYIDYRKDISCIILKNINFKIGK